MTHVNTLTSDLVYAELPWFVEHPEPAAYLTAPYLVLDFETTNIEYGSALVPENKLVCAAWFAPMIHGTTIIFTRGDELQQGHLLLDIDTILKRGGFIVAHNAKFELQWLARMGVDLHKVLVYDTMLGEYVLAGNRRWKLGLGPTGERYGCTPKASTVDELLKAGICPSAMPPELVKARVIKDVKDTAVVFLQQRQRLNDEGRLSVQYTRCLLTPVLADIESNGIGLHYERVKEEWERATVEYESAMLEFNEMTGGINPRSTVQMAHYIYGDSDSGLGFAELKNRAGNPIRNKKSKAFPKGAPKVDAATLDKLRATSAHQIRFLALRKKVGTLNAELTKTLEFFRAVCQDHDAVFYGIFNQAVTQTHRLSSSGRKVIVNKKFKGIQLQNMPRRFKDLICAKEDGWLLAETDGSQLEFRTAAFIGNDEQAKWNIRHDVDQHKLTASVLLDKIEDIITKEERQAAKPDTFKPLYGGRYGTDAQMRYYKWFREEFPDLAKTQEGWTFEVLKTGQLTMPWGMTFHWPFTRQRDDGYIDNTPSIYNYGIQSLATAEIIPIAMVYLWHRIPFQQAGAWGIQLTNTVHDSVTAELPPGTEHIWRQLSIRCFTVDVYEYLEDVYGLEFDVPLGVGITIGERWACPDAWEVEYNVEPSGECWFKGERKGLTT